MHRNFTWQQQKTKKEALGITKEDVVLFVVDCVPVVGPTIRLYLPPRRFAHHCFREDVNQGDHLGMTLNGTSLAIDVITLGGGVLFARPLMAIQRPVVARFTRAVAEALTSKDPHIKPFDNAEVAIAISQREVPGSLPSPLLTADEIMGHVQVAAANIPQRTLQDSNFLRLYNAWPREPSVALIDAMVCPALRVSFHRALKKVDGDIGKAAARLWTGENFYKALNLALVTDNAGLLQHFIGLIRVLNNYLLAYHLKADTTTRRQSRMTMDEANALQIDTLYRVGMYTASSRSMSDLSGVGGNQVVWYFSIPAECFQCFDLKEASFFPHEGEVLFVPYTPLIITRKEMQGGRLCIYADVPKDGKFLPLDCPTILA